MEQTILIVEDDHDINQLLAQVVTRAGYKVVQAYSGTEAQLLISTKTFSLLLLDMMLPGLSGEQLIPVIRKTSNVPIIVVSAKETPQDKVTALKAGADDYICKPFNSEELVARIEANLRRSSGQQGKKVLIHKELLLDGEARCVKLNDEEITLTVREFDILALLMENPNKVFTKNNIYSSVWNDEFLGDDNTINVHISNLRSKLGGKEYIQTVWGIGFKMSDD